MSQYHALVCASCVKVCKSWLKCHFSWCFIKPCCQARIAAEAAAKKKAEEEAGLPPSVPMHLPPAVDTSLRTTADYSYDRLLFVTIHSADGLNAKPKNLKPYIIVTDFRDLKNKRCKVSDDEYKTGIVPKTLNPGTSPRLFPNHRFYVFGFGFQVF